MVPYNLYLEFITIYAEQFDNSWQNNSANICERQGKIAKTLWLYSVSKIYDNRMTSGTFRQLPIYLWQQSISAKIDNQKIREKLSTYFCLTLHDRKSANFRQFFGQIIFAEKEYFQRFTLRKIPWFHLTFWYGNCAFPQNFHTKKVGEITVVYAVLQAVACKSLKSFCFHKQYSREH